MDSTCKKLEHHAHADADEAGALAYMLQPSMIAANERPAPAGAYALSLWDVFVALQDAAEELGATPAEADRLVVAGYCTLQRRVV